MYFCMFKWLFVMPYNINFTTSHKSREITLILSCKTVPINVQVHYFWVVFKTLFELFIKIIYGLNKIPSKSPSLTC